MGNPFYNNNQNNSFGPFNLIQQFNQFRSNFQGDPKQKVQELLNNGQMSQEQFAQLSDMARNFQNMLPRK